VASTGVHPSGRWQRAVDDPRVDGALLLPGLRGAVSPDDPSHRATLAAISAELAEDGYLYRFRHDARPLREAEGAFLICGYWMSEALAQQGRDVEAARWFERTRAACGPPGLQTEEFDVQQRQLRGNLPQAFVHAELLRAGRQLARSGTGSDNPGPVVAARTTVGPEREIFHADSTTPA
jgi:GH15 family glucan-1,4-alpha-glucosidase